MGIRREQILDRAAEAGRQSRRATLRRQAERYMRSASPLQDWVFPASRAVVGAALATPHNPAATRMLCRALYRDWRAAEALPRHFTGRQMRIDALRSLFACECMLYRRQSASVAAQKGMALFLNGLAAR